MHEDKKLTILDLKVWLKSIEENKQIILHEHYHKEVASKTVINKRSAMPKKTIRTILTQEVIRILRNCNKNLEWKETCKHVETFCARMQFSGHNKEMRAQVVRSALNAYAKMREKDEKGENPRYRTWQWKKEERLEKRRDK